MPTRRACKVCGIRFTPEPRRAPPSATCSDECREERLRQTRRAASRRWRGTPDHPDKPCEVCGTWFSPRRKTDKTCSLDCQIQWRRKLSRERAARYYQPRPPRPDSRCESCTARIPAPPTGPMPRWCTACRAAQEDRRSRKRVAVRRCYKCQAPVPEAERKPGPTVCADCRVDKRTARVAKERRRLLRNYGLTKEEFDKLLADQDGRCRGCGTDSPGTKGWCIDHCHQSGRVRALLCTRCNSALGLTGDNPATLRALAEFAEQWQQAMGEITI